MSVPATPKHNLTAIKWLTFLMFMMFAMTTDSVGIIIPEVIKQFRLSMVAAGAFHYANMTAIAVAAIFLGYLADKLGRKKTIILGLVLFALNSYLFAVGNSFAFFLTLLVISGASIGIFKTGALALVGDISLSTSEHTTTMNTVEGFFGVGAIIGPAIVARLLTSGFSWKWLYVIAGTICVLLIAHGPAGEIPEDCQDNGRADRLQAYDAHDEEPLCFGIFAGDFSLCCCGVRRLRLDADAPDGIFRLFCFYCDLCPFSILHFARGGPFPGSVGTDAFQLDICNGSFQPGDSYLFCGRISRRFILCYLAHASVWALHVHDLSDAQFEGHQLLPENGAWRRCRRDLVFHLRRCCSWAIGHGGHQRRIWSSQIWLRPRDPVRSASVCGVASQLDI